VARRGASMVGSVAPSEGVAARALTVPTMPAWRGAIRRWAAALRMIRITAPLRVTMVALFSSMNGARSMPGRRWLRQRALHCEAV
jgi:hypothetical protein